MPIPRRIPPPCRRLIQHPQQRRLISTSPSTSSLAQATRPQPATTVGVVAHDLPPSRPDPFKIMAPQVSELHGNLVRLLGSSHPTLTDVAAYYFSLQGKQLRPLLVFLMSRATNGLASGWQAKLRAGENGPYRRDDLDRPLSSPEVLTDWNPHMPDHTASFSTVFSLPSLSSSFGPPPPPPAADPSPSSWLTDKDPHHTLLPTQTRLAQISEMIHVASLLHDDVLDDAALRRSAESAPFKYGNKLSVLAGDFLLGRTSSVLSRLGESEVVELMASVISNLIEGEVMQAREVENASENGMLESDRWTLYLRKNVL